MSDYTLSEEITRMRNLLDSGEVQRFHAVPSVPMQSVAQHAWGVMAMATFIKTDPRPCFMMHCAGHDCAELFTGDIPFTAKREIPGMRALLEQAEDEAYATQLFHLPRITKAEQVVMKLADMLEGLRWTLHNERFDPSGEQIVHTRWWNALDELFCAEEIDLLNEEERDRAYALFCSFTHPMSTFLTYESHDAFMVGRGNHQRSRGIGLNKQPQQVVTNQDA